MEGSEHSMRRDHDLVIIGGGPAGLAAAIAAREAGIDDLLIIERDNMPGGILNQCIHNGFGLHTFHEELTGPEYARRFVDRVQELNIPVLLGTMVLNLSADRVVTAVSADGVTEIHAKAVILAMGCRERPRGALNIPGSRCAGIYTAGTAQRFVNIEGYMPGREVVILGSGDIGLIMARRMTLEGAKVKAVAELMPYSGGLKRNIVQCLDDFGIPLLLSHTVVRIRGRQRLEGVTIAKVDDHFVPIPGTETDISCDTLLLSVGLIPENELSQKAGVPLSPVTGGPLVDESLQTRVPGIFACGNVLHVHDLVDYVTSESTLAGRRAAEYIRDAGKTGNGPEMPPVEVEAAGGVRYTVPVTIRPDRIEKTCALRFRVGQVYKDHFVSVYFDGKRVVHNKKRILTPGEMETVVLPAQWFAQQPDLAKITVCIEPDATAKEGDAL